MKAKLAVLAAVPLLTWAAVAHSGGSDAGPGTFLPVGNGLIDTCNVERVFAKQQDVDARSDVTQLEDVVYVVLDNGQTVALPNGTDVTVVANEVAASKEGPCRTEYPR